MPDAKPEAKKQASALPGLAADMMQVDQDAPHLSADVDIATVGMTPEDRKAYVERVAEIAKSRRHPFGQFTQKLVLPERPGYKRHWFNDYPGRVEDAEANGWTHVRDKQRKEVKRVVGSQRSGGPLLAYAMEIPRVFWDEDMRRRHEIAQARMDQIRKQPISAQAGMAAKSDLDKFYNPKGTEPALSIRTVDVVEKRPES